MTQLTPYPRSTVQTALTQGMRSICIGRLMMDIPAQYYPNPDHNDVKVQVSFAISSGTTVQMDTPISLEEYNQRVNAQWEEINGNKIYHDLGRYKAPPQKLTPRTNGHVLAYRFVEIYGTKWVDGEIVKVDVEIANDAIGYYWVNNTMFTIHPKGLTNEKTAQIIHDISGYDWSEPPSKPGICLYQSFFEKDYASRYERVVLGIKFTGELGFSLITGSGAGRNPNYPTMLQRIGADVRANPFATLKEEHKLSAARFYRADIYDTAHFKGEEIVQATSEGYTDNYPSSWKNAMSARWEVVGDVYADNLPDIIGGKLYYPDILFQMSVRTQTDFKPNELAKYPPTGSNGKSIPTQEEFFELWDTMVQSIRPYPGAFTPEQAPQKPEQLPGISAQQTAQEKQILDDFLRNG